MRKPYLSTRRYWVVASTRDGEKRRVKMLHGYEDPEDVLHAMRAQLGLTDAATWADSKGFAELAQHVRSLRESDAGTVPVDRHP